MAHTAEVAHKAFLEWRKVPLPQRVRTIFEYRDRVNKNLDKIAETITHEVHFASKFKLVSAFIFQLGKTKADAQGDVLRGLEVVEHCASAATLLLGDSAQQVANNLDVQTFYAPLGVCAGVCPFNFPAMIPMWMYPVGMFIEQFTIISI